MYYFDEVDSDPAPTPSPSSRAVARTPNGDIHVVYTNLVSTDEHLMHNYSTTFFPTSFSNESQVTTGSAGSTKYASFPILLIDTYGTLHCLYTEENDDPAYRRKTTGGAWSSAQVLLSGKTWQMKPGMCIIPEGGTSGQDAIIVAGIESNSGNLYWAYSNDNGQTWTDNQSDTSTFTGLDWGTSKVFPYRSAMVGKPGTGKWACLFVRGENDATNSYVYGLFYDHSTNTWSGTYVTDNGIHYGATYTNCWLSAAVDSTDRFYCMWSYCTASGNKLTYTMASGTSWPTSSWTEVTVHETAITGSTLGSVECPGSVWADTNDNVWFVFVDDHEANDDSLSDLSIWYRVRVAGNTSWNTPAIESEEIDALGSGTEDRVRAIASYGGSTPYPYVIMDLWDGSTTDTLVFGSLLPGAYVSSGEMISDVKDLTADYYTLDLLRWEASEPTGTAITVQTRSGPNGSPPTGWTSWADVGTPVDKGAGDEGNKWEATISTSADQYFQAKFAFSTSDPSQTPTLFWWKLLYSTKE